MARMSTREPGRVRPAGLAALVGGVAWLVVGLASVGVDLGDRAVFTAVEVVWIVVHVLLLVGLLGLYWSGAAAGRLGQIGIGGAVLGRLVFLAAEVHALARGDDETPLLPAAAVLTAVSMVLAGVAVVRSGRWAGWRRLVPLAVGVYPFVLMFPFVAISPEPNLLTLAGWGVLWALLGLALRAAHVSRRTTERVEPADVR